MAVQIEFLKSLPYFSQLDAEYIEDVKKLIFEKTAARGETIALEDDPAEALYFVVSGAVKVYKTSSEGKEQILYVVRPGESFNDVPIFDVQSNPATAEAMGPVVLYGITRSNIETLLRDHPGIAMSVIKVLAERVRHLLSLVEDLSFRHVMGRVAKILLEYASDESSQRPRLTQQEMAAMAGTAREVIGRSLRALGDDGVIRFDRHQIVISDEDALREMVESTA